MPLPLPHMQSPQLEMTSQPLSTGVVQHGYGGGSS